MSVTIRAARSLAYAPQYVALHGGHFARAGVDVVIEEQTPGQSAIGDAVARGDADLVLGSLVFADHLARLVDTEIVAVSNQRSRHMLFARVGDAEESAPFAWDASLTGKAVVVAPTFVPTSWVAFVEVLREHHVSMDDVRFLVGYTPDAVVGEFLSGQGDLLLAGGEEAQDPRLAEVATLAEGYGPVPWSVYCATAEWARAHEDDLDAFRSGLGAAQRWIAEAAPAEIAAVLGPEFATGDAADLEAKIAQYQRIRFWASSPEIVPGQVMRWARSLHHAGVIDTTDRIRRSIPEKEQS